jgi:hypothetical protein
MSMRQPSGDMRKADGNTNLELKGGLETKI